MLFKFSLQIPITFLIFIAPTLLMAEDRSVAKEKICHYDSTNASEGKITAISRSALQAHWDHGDPKEFYVLSKDTCKKVPKKK